MARYCQRSRRVVSEALIGGATFHLTHHLRSSPALWPPWCGCSASEPNVSERFIAHLLARTIRVEEDLVDQFFSSSE
jgi:hypothetical protein